MPQEFTAKGFSHLENLRISVEFGDFWDAWMEFGGVFGFLGGIWVDLGIFWMPGWKFGVDLGVILGIFWALGQNLGGFGDIWDVWMEFGGDFLGIFGSW